MLNPPPVAVSLSATLRPDTVGSETLVDANVARVDEVGSDTFGIVVGPEQQGHEVAWVGAQFL